jgi:uncharacterized OB-fold protein
MSGELRPRAPLRKGLLTEALNDLREVRLVGTRCAACGETSLGAAERCPACGRDGVEAIPLSDRGVLWSYTVVRHRPPGDYRGPEPFAPFGLGLVELPDGVRVLTPILCAVEDLAIGMPLRFRPYLRHDADQDVVMFDFAPAEGAAHV